MVGLVLLLVLFARQPLAFMRYCMLGLFLAGAGYMSGLLDWFVNNIYGIIGEASGEDRIELAHMGLEAIEKFPTFGIGFHNIYRIYDGTPVHSAYLQAMSEIGIAGGLTFLAFVSLVLIRMGILVASVANPSQRRVSKGLLIGLVGMACHLVAEPFFDYNIPWLYMGISVAAIRLYGEGERSIERADAV
jgi:O-antigen ligase